jgi:predicted metalloprotease with PDZ domain
MVPSHGQPYVELAMVVWIPGSYLVREYVRHIISVTAQTPDGKRLDLDKSRKNRWCYAGTCRSSIFVR